MVSAALPMDGVIVCFTKVPAGVRASAAFFCVVSGRVAGQTPLGLLQDLLWLRSFGNPQDKLCDLVEEMGGIVSKDLTVHVTHVIAESLESEKHKV
jgi:hypothetical protein